MRPRIRPVRADELPLLQDIERAAGAPFRDLGMTGIADGDGRPFAYLVCEPVDGALHIEQVSVHPDFAHRRTGRALLAYAADRAREEGLAGLTASLSP